MENERFYRIFKNKGQIGKGVKFGKNVKISGFENIRIGDNVHIGSGCFIRGEGGLIIQDNVFISRNVIIYTTSHDYKGDRLPFDENFIFKDVIIEKNSWIGMNVTISPGAKIGEGSVIGLGSNIFGKIPSLEIIGSHKPVTIGYRVSKHYFELDSKNKYSREEGKPL